MFEREYLPGASRNGEEQGFSMPSPFCNRVQEWLVSNEQLDTVPSQDLCEHVAGCANCRGRLLLLIAALLESPFDQESATCSCCQEDLPAFIDLQRTAGERAALHSYPHVWWHLWTCIECSEVYALTITLLDAVQDGRLDPLA